MEEKAHFYRGMNVLEDLRSLGGAEFSPLIDHANYHFKKIEADLSLDLLSFPQIGTLLTQNISRMMSYAITKAPRIQFLEIEKHIGSYSLEQWDRVLSIIPYLTFFTRTFPFEGKAKLSLDKDGVRLRSGLGDLSDLSRSRVNIYKLTRKLLSKKIVLTYQVLEENGTAMLELYFDIRHDEKFHFVVKDHELSLGFTNLFKLYRSSFQTVVDAGKHKIICISQDQKVYNMSSISEENIKEFSGYDVIHFSFLFRNLSIIIPRGGILTNNKLVSSQEFTGRDNGDNQDVRRFREYSFFDFFQTISQL